MYDIVDPEKSVKAGKMKWVEKNFMSHHFIPFVLSLYVIIPAYFILSKGHLLPLSDQPQGLVLMLSGASTLIIISLYVIYQNDKLVEVPFSGNAYELRKLIEAELIQSK